MFQTANKRLSGSGIYTREGLLEVIDGLPLAIAIIDGNRRIVLVNRAVREFVNKKDVALIGRVGGEAFGCEHHDDVPLGCGFGQDCLKCRLRSTLSDTMAKGEPRHMIETTMVFKHRGERHLRISTQPMILESEPVVLLSMEDVTDAKSHEQTRLEKEKLTAVIQTTGAVCHEMSQPVMAIMGFADLLMVDLGDDSILTPNLLEIKKQADRLGNVTKKLMRITRYQTKPYLGSEIIDIDAASEARDP